jgi:hypothetical protein
MGRRLPAILCTEPCQGFDSLTFWASAPVLCPLLFCEERLGQLWSRRTRVFKKVICCSISVTGRSIARSLKDIKRLLHSLQGPRILASCCARAASGHAAAPPTSDMNSRRWQKHQRRRSTSSPRTLQRADGLTHLMAKAEMELRRTRSQLRAVSYMRAASVAAVVSAASAAIAAVAAQLA